MLSIYGRAITMIIVHVTPRARNIGRNGKDCREISLLTTTLVRKIDIKWPDIFDASSSAFIYSD